MQLHRPAAAGAGAARPQRTTAAPDPEHCVVCGGDRHGMPARTGDPTAGLVDVEVVTGEPALDRPAQPDGLYDRYIARTRQRRASLATPISRLPYHLRTRLLPHH